MSPAQKKELRQKRAWSRGASVPGDTPNPPNPERRAAQRAKHT